LRVWFDLTNSPHVLVLRPLIEALQADGAEVAVTARDFAQTVALCERFGIDCEVIGRHRGAKLGA
jgi:predicted glycosyltransferase